jgi:hypothetical protein
MSGQSQAQSNKERRSVKPKHQDTNEIMSEELGEEDKNNDQGSLSKESDPDSDDKNQMKDSQHVLQFGELSIHLGNTAFGPVNYQNKVKPNSKNLSP